MTTAATVTRQSCFSGKELSSKTWPFRDRGWLIGKIDVFAVIENRSSNSIISTRSEPVSKNNTLVKPLCKAVRGGGWNMHAGLPSLWINSYSELGLKLKTWGARNSGQSKSYASVRCPGSQVFCVIIRATECALCFWTRRVQSTGHSHRENAANCSALQWDMVY